MRKCRSHIHPEALGPSCCDARQCPCHFQSQSAENWPRHRGTLWGRLYINDLAAFQKGLQLFLQLTRLRSITAPCWPLSFHLRRPHRTSRWIWPSTAAQQSWRRWAWSGWRRSCSAWASSVAAAWPTARSACSCSSTPRFPSSTGSTLPSRPRRPEALATRMRWDRMLCSSSRARCPSSTKSNLAAPPQEGLKLLQGRCFGTGCWAGLCAATQECLRLRHGSLCHGFVTCRPCWSRFTEGHLAPSRPTSPEKHPVRCYQPWRDIAFGRPHCCEKRVAKDACRVH